MANELQVTFSASYTPNAAAAQETLSLSSASFTIAGAPSFEKKTQSIPTSATALNLGALATIGWLFVKNLDPTNYVTLLTATAGTAFGRVAPGAAAVLYLDPTVTAPAAQAHTAACVLEFMALPI